MFLEPFYTEEQGKILFTRQQASDFAKQIADDFNPLHDIDAKRFCVPGDLLFSVLLAKRGLSQQMRFQFSGMVNDGVGLILPKTDCQEFAIVGDNDKEYLSVSCSGDVTTDATLIQSLTSNYVAFSGKTFPHVLVPLMEEKNVMINPERPMVIYESMSISLKRLDIPAIDLEMSHSTLDVNGKRGNVKLAFSLTCDGEVVGSGEKQMVLSGLRPFEADTVQALVDDYIERKQQYKAA